MLPISPRARRTYLALSSLARTLSTSTPTLASSHHPTDFGQPFTSLYEPNSPTSGPLGDPSVFSSSPRLTPKALKAHLDQFVVGQERAKKILSVAVYNHYQRIQELQRRDDEEAELLRQQLRRDSVGDKERDGGVGGGSPDPEFIEYREDTPPRRATRSVGSDEPNGHRGKIRTPADRGRNTIQMEKSNVLMLGPTGVGKTLLAKTLAQTLDVPFSMSDCTPLTQAGYIGEDVEVVIQRLLAAANYDVQAAERGIICLDEVDKIAKGKMTHGKDVSGEGVQQALLKIVEGTTVTVTAKPDRNAASNSPRSSSSSSSPSSQFPGSIPGLGSAIPGSPGGGGGGGGGKAETYTVRTDNILFLFCGAFVGLQKIILDRLAKGSIGFNAPIRSVSSSSSSEPSSSSSSSLFTPTEELHFRKSLPFFTPQAPTSSSSSDPPLPFNPLDLCEPHDLQTYGLIWELTGRIPTTVALSPLTIPLLLRVLTEPRNSLLSQYTHLFSLSGAELRFTTPALHVVARTALEMGTGARGLRTVMERLLAEAMFEVPGGSVKYVLVDRRAAEREGEVLYFGRGAGGAWREKWEGEEGEWRERVERREARRRGKEREKEGGEKGKGKGKSKGDGDGETVESFEEYREKGRAGGAA